MTRQELQYELLGPQPDRLWVPLLAHYSPGDGPPDFDPLRTRAHVQAIRPYASQFIIAGYTGDGWDMAPRQFSQILDFLHSDDAFDADCRILIAALAPTTDEVVEQVQAVEDALPSLGQPQSPLTGVIVCPADDETWDQDQIATHYRTVLANSSAPLAVYQLPQIAGCRIQPATLRKLALDEPRIILFADSSGPDFVAKSAAYLDGIIMIRGVEGRYAESLRPIGTYDGLLTGSANVFAEQLRQILDLLAGGAGQAAIEKSDRLSEVVRRMLATVGSLPFGNPLSNASRIVDHLLACGNQWNQIDPPLTYIGSTYEIDLMAEFVGILSDLIDLPDTGYLAQQGSTL